MATMSILNQITSTISKVNLYYHRESFVFIELKTIKVQNRQKINQKLYTMG